MTANSHWLVWALLSAVFAAATAILAKAGVQQIDADLATLLRTLVITALLAAHPGETLEHAAMTELPRLCGAFSLVFLDENTLYGARDPQGIRPSGGK